VVSPTLDSWAGYEYGTWWRHSVMFRIRGAVYWWPRIYVMLSKAFESVSVTTYLEGS
jgi:hypothetical protein